VLKSLISRKEKMQRKLLFEGWIDDFSAKRSGLCRQKALFSSSSETLSLAAL
jgi:hypothetical protein